MCEIQFIKKINGKLNKEDINNFLEMLECGSFTNPHAYGIFNNAFMYKNKGSFKTINNKKKIKITDKILQKKTDYLIGHNRFATEGTKKHNKNNHPFVLKDYVMCHNGIISNSTQLKKKFKFDYDIKTDSAIILYLFEYFVRKYDNEVMAIQETTKLLHGYYSVMLLNRKTNKLYYFKSKKAEFTFGLLEFGKYKLLVGTTDAQNLSCIYQETDLIFDKPKYKGIKVKQAETGIIYLINGDKPIKKVGGFEEHKEEITYTFYGHTQEHELEEMFWCLAEMLGYDSVYLDKYEVWFDFENNLVKIKNVSENDRELLTRHYLFSVMGKNIIITYDDMLELTNYRRYS